MDAARSEQPISKAGHQKLSQTDTARLKRVKQMFEEWLEDSSGYDEEVWPELKRALNDSHSKTHKLFDD